MTRYARSGSTQKHKKVPGAATPWSEFSKPGSSSSMKQKGIFKKNFKHHKPYKAQLNSTVTFNKTEKEQQTDTMKCVSNINKLEEKSSYQQNVLVQKDKEKNKFAKLDSDNKQNSVVNTGEEKSPLQQNVSSKKKNKKNKFCKQNNTQDSNINVDGEKSPFQQNISAKKKIKKKKINKQLNSKKESNNDHSETAAASPENKVFESKKNVYMSKLKKKRANQKMLLLPSKVERKLYNIKKILREQGCPIPILKDVIRKERRKEEIKFRKAFNSSKPCYNCRETGHLLADCPEKLNSSGSSNHKTGICFKCGSVDHTSFKCPSRVQGFSFAKCFICKEQGHISRDCPKNTHGVYIKGGRCSLCGNVNHLRKDCPSLQKKKEEEPFTLHTINEVTSIDEDIIVEQNAKRKKVEKKPKVVKF